ncbi:MAG TPA: histidine kinase, partial [Sphingobium sp.]|nr:histidine kinase [Sphingobium sp.]
MPSLFGMTPARSSTLLPFALLILMIPPFLADMALPLGMSVWVLYLLPLTLSYMTSRAIIPPLLAVTATLLMAIGYQIAPAGVDPTVAQVNRSLGGLTAWLLGGLGYAFIRTKLAVRREEWVQRSQIGLGRAMAGERNLQTLGEDLLRNLVTRLDAQAALLFVDDGAAYRRVASIGVPQGADIISSTGPDDGLIGVAITERRIVRVGPVPPSYLAYGASMGQAAPTTMLVAPACADDDVVAVLEIGFAQEPDAQALILLERAGEAIGKAIRAARYRERLQELLEETQQQSEELQAQSEELRSANEELEEQSRVLLDSQARLETQQAELEQTNVELEEQTQQLVQQRNDLTRAQASL